MGNYKFRLSDIMPNSWFYKLKEMGKTRRSHRNTQSSTKKKMMMDSTESVEICRARKSYYFTRELQSPLNPRTATKILLDPARKSAKQRIKTRILLQSSPKLVTSPVSSACNCRVWNFSPEHESVETLLPELRYDKVLATQSCICPPNSNADEDVLNLAPIVTKSSKNMKKKETKPVRVEKENRITAKETGNKTTNSRRFSVNSPGLRLRNSPRMTSRKIGTLGKKSLSSSSSSSSGRSISDSFAVMKSSENPKRDFRNSMLEMIVENNIRASKDLEDLLACYLTLNSDEYHDLIIKVFKQIWFDLTVNRSSK